MASLDAITYFPFSALSAQAVLYYRRENGVKKVQDYYTLLGVGQEASQREIKKSFRELMHKYHPDKGSTDPEAEKMFLAITKAYNVLIDERKRVLYDHYGASLAPEYVPPSDIFTGLSLLIETVRGLFASLTKG